MMVSAGLITSAVLGTAFLQSWWLAQDWGFCGVIQLGEDLVLLLEESYKVQGTVCFFSGVMGI